MMLFFLWIMLLPNSETLFSSSLSSNHFYKKKVIEVRQENDTTIYQLHQVDEVAIFENKSESNGIFKFIMANTVCPKFDILSNTKLYLEFIIEKDGKLSDIKDEKLKNALGKCAIDALKKCPKWKPAKIKGKNVRQKYFLYVSCILWG